jgi:hypothetical protein
MNTQIVSVDKVPPANPITSGLRMGKMELEVELWSTMYVIRNLKERIYKCENCDNMSGYYDLDKNIYSCKFCQ